MLKLLNSSVDLIGLGMQSHAPTGVFLLHFEMCSGMFSEVGFFSFNKVCVLISIKYKEYVFWGPKNKYFQL